MYGPQTVYPPPKFATFYHVYHVSIVSGMALKTDPFWTQKEAHQAILSNTHHPAPLQTPTKCPAAAQCCPCPPRMTTAPYFAR